MAQVTSLTRQRLQSAPPFHSEMVPAAARRAGNCREFRRRNTASYCRTSKPADAGEKMTGHHLTDRLPHKHFAFYARKYTARQQRGEVKLATICENDSSSSLTKDKVDKM